MVRLHQLPEGAQLGEYPLTSIGEVFYRDPAGNKIRSMKQISLCRKFKRLCELI